MSDALEGWLEQARAWSEGLLERALQERPLGPAAHAEALRYALLGGGKRLRPSLVRLACHALGGQDAQAEAPAVALELIHTYSLVHDDLPCMDDDDLRRGRPTTHKVFGEAEAVLVGDGLQALAFEVLGDSGAPRGLEMVRALARAAGPEGMVGGQSADLAATGEQDRRWSAEEVHAIHRRKTGALISAATELGALAAEARPAEVSALARYGALLGALFQARDDVLDVTGNAAELGKTPGKDAASDKGTLVAALGLEGARQRCRELAEQARGAAQAALGERPAGPAGELLRELPTWLERRTS